MDIVREVYMYDEFYCVNFFDFLFLYFDMLSGFIFDDISNLFLEDKMLILVILVFLWI